mgnify:CR=1 FL=1
MNDTNQLTLQSFNEPTDNDTLEQDLKEFSSDSNPLRMVENNQDSFSTQDLESDDDTLQQAHHMGIAPDADLENVTELNLAEDIIHAQAYRQNK